jgi:DNA-binding XRE family transcriptional regulator
MIRTSRHKGLKRLYENDDTRGIEPLGLTITQAAAALGVTRTTLSELVNGKRGISPEMAIRLSQVFGGARTIGSRNKLNMIWPRSLKIAFN